jgi:hypothetical protein
MDHNIVKIDAGNYSLFDDMVYWRMNGSERLPSKEAEALKQEKCAAGIRRKSSS